MRFLIVDDDKISRIKLKKLLSSFGECDIAENGLAAIQLFREAWEDWNPYDMITLDIEMPGMNGEEVLIELRDMEFNKNMPADKKVKIIMVTSHSDSDSVANCITAGCNTFLIKPFDKKAIQTIIGDLF